MPTINQLSSLDTVSSSDQVPVYSNEQGDARKASMATIAKFLKTLMTSSDNMVTQYAAPSATGFTVQVQDGPDNIWLVLTPTGGMSSGMIKMPYVTNALDRQEILVTTSQTITALTVNANYANTVGAPSTLAAGEYFRMRFEAVTDTWYRVG